MKRDVLQLQREVVDVVSEHQALVYQANNLIQELKALNFTKEQEEIMEEEFGTTVEFMIEELEYITL